MIELKGLSKSYGAKKVLEGVDLTIPSGSLFGLIGINGAGKSTLLRLVADVLRPDAGEILVDGESVHGNEKRKREMFFLPDDPYFTTGTTVEKLVAMYKTFYPFDADVFKRYAELFRLQMRTPIRNFSKGMKRQAFVALALACRPRYLLLDEAFDGLDPLARLELKRGLIELNEQAECTTLISSHSLRELEDVCSGFALLDGGTVADAGTPEEAISRFNKFQVALPREAKREDFPFECISFEATGRVAKFVAVGDREAVLKAIEPLAPLFVEEIRIDFEELFLCEVRSRGYLK